MDFARILAELRQEKNAIEQAILSIEKLAGEHGTGEPGSMEGLDAPRKRGRPKGSKNKSHPAATNAAGVGFEG